MNENTVQRYTARIVCSLTVVALVVGCSQITAPTWLPKIATQPAATDPDQNTLPIQNATSVAQLDQSTTAERRAATQPSSGQRRLGTTIASLGTPSEPGFWLKTPLVAREVAGTVRSRDTGKRASVTLIPIGGPTTAGSRLSLSAMRLLGVSLTELAELDVSTNG